jgi:hypothetical protein
MSQCKHKGCPATALEDSVYCKDHQLATRMVRQRTTRGGDDQAPNDHADDGGSTDRANKNNPPKEDGRAPDQGGPVEDSGDLAGVAPPSSPAPPPALGRWKQRIRTMFGRGDSHPFSGA